MLQKNARGVDGIQKLLHFSKAVMLME